MAGTLKHRFQSTVVDEGVSGEIGPNDWNDSFVMAQGSDGDAAVRRTSATDGWELIKLGAAPANVNSTTAGNSGAAETDLHSWVIVAGHFSVNNKAIRLTGWGDFAANANVKTLRFKIGGTTFVLNPTVTAPNAKKWYSRVTVIRTGASAELAFAETLIDGVVVESLLNATPAENTANAITMKWTGQATANNDVRQLGSHVEYLG